MNTFLEEAKNYRKVTPAQATELIESKSGKALFIGRETCPFCRKFSTKLANVVKQHNLDVAFLHSQDFATLDEVQVLRNKYGVPTVPGFIYSDENGIKVKCDSSMTEKEILDFATGN